jgi:hypothetical protein
VFRLSKNFAVAYVLLVVLPVFGLAGILSCGQNLKAPASVDGIWAFQIAATRGAMRSCMSALGFDLDTLVTISQSGTNLTINAEKTGGTGLIVDTTLQAALRSAGTRLQTRNCGGDGSVLLTATVEANPSFRVLSGALSASSCPSCESVRFHAVKQASTQAKGVQ